MTAATRIHWARVAVGGFLAEVAVFVALVPVFLLFGQRALPYAAPVASLVMMFLFAVWVGRRIESRFVLHGVLVGIVATLLYVALTLAQPEPFMYLVAHGLKIVGGAAGGFVAGRRAKTATATRVDRAGAV
jgi:putative membrane protein (TIGR04086 family)